jgi:thioredoxin 1
MTITNLTESNFHDFINQSEVPVVIDFWAEWCGPCKMIAPTIEKLSQEHSGKLSVGKVDIDSNTELAEQYHVRSIPTLMVFHNGNPSQVIVGAQKDLIEEKINQLV